MKLLAPFLLLSFAFAQTIDDANKQLAASDWSDAQKSFSALTRSTPDSGAAWAGLGESELQLKHFDAASAAFGKAVDLKFRPGLNRMNQVRVLAARGDRAGIVSAVRAAANQLASGFVRTFVLSSSEFEPLLKDSEFKKLVDEELRPCRKPEFRQFDFWVGDWRVFDPAEKQQLGRNLVTLEQDGCLIVEHWTAATGGQTGSSFNYFDIRDNKWHQLYIDNSGNAGAFPELSGSLVEGKIVMLTATTNGQQSRWSWYPLDATGKKVRQMAEQTTDGGKTWSITWDSTYIQN